MKYQLENPEFYDKIFGGWGPKDKITYNEMNNVLA